MSFLPEGTEIPKRESNYTTLESGENRFRILGSAIVGYELWVGGNPIRNRTKAEFTSEELANADTNKFTGLKKVPEYFWAFPIWNYNTEKVEICEFRQATILRGMEDFLNDEDYGKDPKEYDFVVNKDDKGERVEYRVKAKPPKEIDRDILKAYEDIDIRLEALFEGADPFNFDRATEEDLERMVKEI